MMDNYYTRHNLAAAIKKFTDSEVRILGTCKLNLVDAINKINILKAIENLKDKEHGSWYLVAAYNRHPDCERNKENMPQHVDDKTRETVWRHLFHLEGKR